MDAGFRWIFSGFFALIPAIFFAIGLADALDQVRLFANPASTQGTIVAPDEGRVYEAGVTPPSPQPFDPTDTLMRFRYTVDDAPDHYNADEAYGEADKAADAAEDAADDAYDIDQDPNNGPR